VFGFIKSRQRSVVKSFLVEACSGRWEKLYSADSKRGKKIAGCFSRGKLNKICSTAYEVVSPDLQRCLDAMKNILSIFVDMGFKLLQDAGEMESKCHLFCLDCDALVNICTWIRLNYFFLGCFSPLVDHSL